MEEIKYKQIKMKKLTNRNAGIALLLLLLVAFYIHTLFKPVKSDINYQKIRKQAVRESLIPIRPGIPNQQPFWNNYSVRFIHAPSFNFKPVNDAKKYKFTLSSSDNMKYCFIADNPWADLSPVWEKIPVGNLSLEVYGIDKNGALLDMAGSKSFYKASAFNGPYNKKVMDYKESVKRAMKYIYKLDHIQNWKTFGSPDSTYDLYCYPSKIIGAVIGNMLVYRKLFPTEEENALAIARKAGEYLISISEPHGFPLEYFPPTYRGEARTAKEYKGQFMMIYPAEVAINYLDLFDITHDSVFFRAAIKIASTYIKLQLPSGTWKLKLWENGESVNDNDCIPLPMIALFDRLHSQYKLDEYQASRDRAFNWVMDNPVKTYDWSGQYEDVALFEPYRNLTKAEACTFAIYLFNRTKENPSYRTIAEELLRFSEDQFVIWERPMPRTDSDVHKWFIPCALEQYNFYVPIDGSASKLIATYLKAAEVTGEKIYLAKAIELANTMTVAQLPDTGKYPTYWEEEEAKVSPGWINCALADAIAMLDLWNFLNKTK